jgi:hypothetical protein
MSTSTSNSSTVDSSGRSSGHSEFSSFMRKSGLPAGYLWKRGESVFGMMDNATWKKRWFILDGDQVS